MFSSKSISSFFVELSRERENDTEGGMDIGRGGLKKDIVTDSERETERERKVDTHLET